MVLENSSGWLFVATGGCRWTRSKLHRIAIDVPKVFETYAVQTRDIGDGKVRGEYSLSPRHLVQFVSDASVGHNIVSVTLFDGNDGEQSSSYRVKWGEQGNVFFVNELERAEPDRSGWAYGGGNCRWAWRLIWSMSGGRR